MLTIIFLTVVVNKFNLIVNRYLFIPLFVKQHYNCLCIYKWTPKYCGKRVNSLRQSLTSNARQRLNYDTGSIANILSLAWLHFMMVLGAQWMIVHTRGGLLECCKCVQHFRGRDTNDRLELEVTDSVRLRRPQPESKKSSDSF